MYTLGNIITDDEREAIEPYNPDYLLKDGYTIPELSGREKRFCRKVGTLYAKLRKEGICANWLCDYEMFEVRKTNPRTGYDWVMYVAVDMDENTYNFGGETEDICVDGHASVVVAAVKEWMSNNKPSCR